jgi:predicted Zn-dependent protease with MMP-like domain
MFRARPPRYGTPPTADDIATLAEQALAEIPRALARHVQNVGIVVEDAADDETLEEMGIESAWELTGLYRGTPLIHRTSAEVAPQPDLVFLFREPILLEWIETGEDLYRLVRAVVIHEIAHHIGFSDEEIDRLERE